MSVVYLSFDGALEPLGASQVVAPLLRLAQRGYAIRLLTLEKTDAGRRALARRLRDAGIDWCFAPYRSSAANLRALSALALAQRPVELLHARSLQAAIVALAVQKTLGARLLFDTRAYWAKQRRAQGRLRGLRYGIALGLEQAACRKADALVTLTELAAREQGATCIPTLADERVFTLDRRSGAPPPGIHGQGLVLGFVGSVNADYLVDPMLALWRRIAALRPDAQLLALSEQEDALRARLRAIGATTERVVFARLPHGEMAQALSWIDWGLMFLRSDESKRASMPTKLGEFLLSGVRPVQHGCNSEVSRWVERAGTGLSLAALDLDQAAARMLHDVFAPLAHGRAVALQHFALERGVEAYARLWDQLTA